MKFLLKQSYGRLLSTRPELLPAWKQVFNNYEAFAENRDPFANIYTAMIDGAINGVSMNYDNLVEQCEGRVVTLAK